MSSWPVSLQQKLNVAGFTKTKGNARVATDMDVGPAKVRNRYTKLWDIYSCEILLDNQFDEVATFETFYETTLGNGSLPFTFNDPFTGDPTSFRFVPGADPDISPTGNGGTVFTLRMKWERLPA